MLPESLGEPAANPLPPTVEALAPLTRARALVEVVLCSGFPTQIVAAVALAGVGIRPEIGGGLSPLFIFAISAIDTVLLIGLIFWLLRTSGDRASAVFLGSRQATDEIAFGVVLVPIVFGLVMVVQLLILTFFPTLRNVPVSPFGSMLESPLLLAGFIALVIIAGGLREELQRAFLLNRFERQLGGPWVGVIVTSLAFGLGHTIQGWDAAIITGLLGATWGVIYVVRRSAVAAITSHALFNIGQVAAAYAFLR